MTEGTITPEEESQLAEHLDRCDECRGRLDALIESSEPLRVFRQVYGEASRADAKAIRTRCVAAGDRQTTSGNPPLLEGLKLPPPRDHRFLARLGDYDVVSRLGKGGMGFVFKGYEQGLRRYVALKVMRPGLAGDPVARRRFVLEGQSAAGLQHPNIVVVYRAGTDGDLPYLAMEYVRGSSLATLIAEESPLEPRRASELLLQVLEALAHAHREGTIHRDVKPGNVLLDLRLGLAKLADFGLARGVDDAMHNTGDGSIVGTAWYMAPEQAEGSRGLDGRCDLFSTGAMFFEMLTRQRPFPGLDPQEVLVEVNRGTTPDPRQENPAVTEALARVVCRAMEKDRARRYASAEEFAAAIRSCFSPKDRAACQYEGCGDSPPWSETFVCARCGRRMCRRHRDEDHRACCRPCAEESRADEFDRESRRHEVRKGHNPAVARLAKLTQPRPPFEARVWTERGPRLPTRDILTVARRSKDCFRIGDSFTLNVQAEVDCYVTLLDVGSSGAFSLLLENFPLRAGPPVSLSGPDRRRTWEVGPPPGVERIRAFFTRTPLAVVPETAPFEATAVPGIARDIVVKIAAAGLALADLPADSWTDATCEFLIEG